MKRLRNYYLLICGLSLLVLSCEKNGEIKIQNRISKTVITNVYWGNVYIGGNLKPGEETEFIEIHRSDEKLPATHHVFFSIEEGDPDDFYTDEWFDLDKDDQLFIVLTDSTIVYEKE